jgi:sugar lactone lactonase YvrE
MSDTSAHAFDVLVEGIAFPESPRWHDGRLWFSDWLAHQVIAVDPRGGGKEVVAEVDAFPFSIDWLPSGRMLITAGRRLLRMEADGSLSTHADLSDLTEFGLNEIVIDDRGYVYVNGAGFDLMGGGEFSPGIVALLRPDGSTEIVADGVAFPNGMAITPDGATLIVADSYGNQLIGFDIGSDGRLSGRRTWADLGDDNPDGICLDAEGAAWYADVPHRHCVRVTEGGDVLQTVEVDTGCFACMLGGSDETTLFVAAQEWNGPEAVGKGPRTGRILAVEARAAHSGHP